MSRRRKHVSQALQQEVEPPKDNQYIVRALGSRGDNLVEVEFPDGRTELALLPARFNKKLWIKRGGFVIIEQQQQPQQQSEEKARITATIETVLFPDDQALLQKLGCWPLAFSGKKSEDGTEMKKEQRCGENEELDSSDSDLPPLEPNTNRQTLNYDFEDSEDSNGEEEEG